ncbi:MAG: hypothetical protein DI626_11610 [Micavibrio aeruginosavorus]|uniref:Uncharacterized protein n=1 Tax=Micavibrio aeruginosavorus TaxID=349221 RepID=A0A2W4ZD36_9BACT|nr:MAG: hypothetical protein DI626_11610 [Micavibrio aeruginosavorus]
MSGLLTNIKEGQRAWVVFSGQTEISWLRFLKPGFRHCYVLINDGERWMSVDPLSHLTDISVHHHVPVDFDLPGWLAARGNRVVKAPLRRDVTRPAPFMIFTCVEAVKRVLGIHCRKVVTPWQLYRHLTHAAA